MDHDEAEHGESVHGDTVHGDTVHGQAGRKQPGDEQSGVAGFLRAKRAELLGEMGLLEQKPTDHGSISFGKRVGEGTSMAVDRLSQVAVHDRLQTTLADVERALAKLDEGTYGQCDVCGGPVGEERLDALPWAVRCVADAGRP